MSLSEDGSSAPENVRKAISDAFRYNLKKKSLERFSVRVPRSRLFTLLLLLLSLVGVGVVVPINAIIHQIHEQN